MKRIEMIEIISVILRLTGNHYCDDGRDIEDADKILKALEDVGMLPPCSDCRDKDDLCGRRECDNFWDSE